MTKAQVQAHIAASFSLEASAKTITGVAAADSVVTVTAASHGYAAGDWVLITGVAGAVEANGLWVVASVPGANSFTLTGITAVTTYTSGGAARKVTVSGLLRDVKPYAIDGVRNALQCVPHVRNHDGAAGAEESTLATMFA